MNYPAQYANSTKDEKPCPRLKQKWPKWDFPGGALDGSPPANAEDTGSNIGPGRSHMSQSN